MAHWLTIAPSHRCFSLPDGTLAHMNGDRSPYEYDKVSGDTLDELVYDMLCYHASLGRKIIISTGRDGVCKNDTLLWLQKHDILF